MKIEKYLLNEKEDPKPKGYKLVPIPKIPDTCSNCKYIGFNWNSDISFCANSKNMKDNKSDISIIISDNGWCPQYKRSK